MGLVVSRVWNRFFGSTRYKLCMLGLDNAGKTTILYRWGLGEVVETQPTIGSNVESVKHRNLELQVWDVGGQTALRQIWDMYFVNSAAVIFVIDSTDVTRLPLVKAELQRVLLKEALHRTPLLILANKQDAHGALAVDDIARMLELTSVTDRAYRIQPTSATTGAGLTDALDWLADTLTKTTA